MGRFFQGFFWFLRDGSGFSWNALRQGFRVVAFKTALCSDSFFREKAMGRYYGEVCSAVQEATGADKVLAFHHNVRHQRPVAWLKGVLVPCKAEKWNAFGYIVACLFVASGQLWYPSTSLVLCPLPGTWRERLHDQKLRLSGPQRLHAAERARDLRVAAAAGNSGQG